jgi:phage repressor protein C with HTH and peptisase S24 domain
MPPNQTPRRDKIVDAIRKSGEAMSPKEISDTTGLNPKNVRGAVREMKANHTLVQPGYGQYDLPEHHHLDEESRRQLRDARKKIGYTHSGAASYLRKRGLDISEEELTKWERGTLDEPPPASLQEVIEAYESKSQRSESKDLTTASRNGTDDISNFYTVPKIELDSEDGVQIVCERSGILFTESYIRRRYGIPPDKITVLEVEGDGMKDTLQPGQQVIAALCDDHTDLQGDAIYGIRNDVGPFIKRLRFDRQDGDQVIWVSSDNDSGRDFCLTHVEFEQEYNVMVRLLEVKQRL